MIVSELVAQLQGLANQTADVLIDVSPWDRALAKTEVAAVSVTVNGQLVLQPAISNATRLETDDVA